MDDLLLKKMSLEAFEQFATSELRKKLEFKDVLSGGYVSVPVGLPLPPEAYHRRSISERKRPIAVNGLTQWWEVYEKVIAAGTLDELDSKLDDAIDLFVKQYWELKTRNGYIIPALAVANAAVTTNTKGVAFSYHLQLRMTLVEEEKKS